ncbi:MAG TPA: HD domain-containing protein [Longimicrobiales bacterium]|nr:HD domain-containing protein [Longimicrobiales bacterium]
MIHEVLRAASFAARKHSTQRRKGRDASPYINHPLEVAEILARHGVDEVPLIQAALLHDTVEDTETTFEELTREFGEEVAGLVAEVTDDKSLQKQERKELQIRHAPGLSHSAKLIKIADKVSNARDVSENPPADWDLRRRVEYLEWTRAVVDGCRGVNAGLDARYDEVLAAGMARLGSAGQGTPEGGEESRRRGARA